MSDGFGRLATALKDLRNLPQEMARDARRLVILERIRSHSKEFDELLEPLISGKVRVLNIWYRYSYPWGGKYGNDEEDVTEKTAPWLLQIFDYPPIGGTIEDEAFKVFLTERYSKTFGQRLKFWARRGRFVAPHPMTRGLLAEPAYGQPHGSTTSVWVALREKDFHKRS